MLEAASSIKSIALSGSCLSLIYRLDKLAAATIAGSVISTEWCNSYLSFNPRNIAMVSSTDGWSTRTFWNLLSNAASFSINCLYSSSVVAPTQCNSPRARAGLSILPASIAPSPLPAPTIVCNSSINKITRPSSLDSSFKTAFKRSSNSPRYFAPASNAPISSDKTRFPFNPSGTSPLIIRCAKPSAMAVLPTPGSPIKTGLFLVLRCNTWTVLLISSSLPMTGSSFPCSALSVRSVVYFSRAWRTSSAFWSVTFWPFLTSSIALSTLDSVKPIFFKISVNTPLS